VYLFARDRRVLGIFFVRAWASGRLDRTIPENTPLHKDSILINDGPATRTDHSPCVLSHPRRNSDWGSCHREYQTAPRVLHPFTFWSVSYVRSMPFNIWDAPFEKTRHPHDTISPCSTSYMRINGDPKLRPGLRR
jgi:hypothetical protein